MTFDPVAGNSYNFDAENRITGAGGYTYTYDADGNRVEKSKGTTGTIYWYTTLGIVAESDLSGNLTSEYVFFDGDRVARKDFPGNSVSYYFSDHLKTASVITDSSGNILSESDYYPWGGEVQFVNSDPNHYKFTGKERDAETQLDYFGARYYGNWVGRFTSVDPSIQSAFLVNPQAWNRYTYALNNPLRFIDPTGELWTAADNGGYSWVDQCGDGQTCYEAVATASGNNLVIYGSLGSDDISTYTANDKGYIDLNNFADNANSYFDVKDGAHSFLSLNHAAGFFNTAEQYHEKHPDDSDLVVTDAGKSDGSGFPPHKTHDLGRSVDLRYTDESGNPVTSDGKKAASDKADVNRVKDLVDLGKKNGFNQNYIAKAKDFGTSYAPGHETHLHLGATKPVEEKIKPNSK